MLEDNFCQKVLAKECPLKEYHINKCLLQIKRLLKKCLLMKKPFRLRKIMPSKMENRSV